MIATPGHEFARTAPAGAHQRRLQRGQRHDRALPLARRVADGRDHEPRTARAHLRRRDDLSRGDRIRRLREGAARRPPAMGRRTTHAGTRSTDRRRRPPSRDASHLAHRTRQARTHGACVDDATGDGRHATPPRNPGAGPRSRTRAPAPAPARPPQRAPAHSTFTSAVLRASPRSRRRPARAPCDSPCAPMGNKRSCTSRCGTEPSPIAPGAAVLPARRVRLVDKSPRRSACPTFERVVHAPRSQLAVVRQRPPQLTHDCQRPLRRFPSAPRRPRARPRRAPRR